MANMLRKKASHVFGCCDQCARGKPLHLKPGPRERHLARAREKRQWKRENEDKVVSHEKPWKGRLIHLRGVQHRAGHRNPRRRPRLSTHEVTAMCFRRGIYLVSAITVTGLLAELAWFVLDRHPIHLRDRTIRLLNR